MLMLKFWTSKREWNELMDAFNLKDKIIKI